MDTRSVVRSRRRSARLTGQSLQEDRVKRGTTSKGRDSGHNKSANSSSNPSRESSCPPADPNLKPALLVHDAHPASLASKAAKASAKDEDNGNVLNGNVLPLFPNLPSSKEKATETSRAETHSIITPPTQPVDTSSEKAVKSRASTKWVKTARGSIRLASDSSAEDSNSSAGNKYGEARNGQNASFMTGGRRSRRLTCMMPDVRDEIVETEPLHSRRPMAIKAKAPASVALGSERHQESEPELQYLFTKATAELDPSTHSDFPTHDGKSDPLLPQPEVQQNTSPIPALLADIERIIQSSPLADRNRTDDGAEGTTAPTPTQALKKRASANVLTRSRTLRSSTRSIGNTGKTGESSSFEKIDSDSSQFDGAFDDIIRGQRRKKTHVRTADSSKPSEPRGTKRSVQELSEAEESVDSPSLRQRRKPGSDGPKPRVGLNSSNPMEVTSRDASSTNGHSVRNALEISEVARRAQDPANLFTLAEMASTNSERADSTNNPLLAGDNSQRRNQVQSCEEDTNKCADCGRVPERYLVCAKCQETIYCGKYCQIWNWPLHKTRCRASDEAVQAEIELQETYLGDMWEAALKMLKEENMAGGTVESLLLGEAVRHSATRPAFMGQGRPRVFDGLDVESSQLESQNSQSLSRARAMSIRFAEAAQGGDE